MGKVVTIYLSDEETRDLKDFCDTNRCTQYGALKTAVKQLLYTSMQSLDADTIIEEQETETQIDDTEATRIQEEIDLATKIRSARAFLCIVWRPHVFLETKLSKHQISLSGHESKE